MLNPLCSIIRTKYLVVFLVCRREDCIKSTTNKPTSVRDNSAFLSIFKMVFAAKREDSSLRSYVTSSGEKN